MDNNIIEAIENLELEYGNGESTGCYSEHIDCINRIAHLRHKAHCGRLNDTDEINECLSLCNIPISIDDPNEVHDTINPILLQIENEWGISVASHGISALNSNF